MHSLSSHSYNGSNFLPDDSLQVVATPDLYSLSVKWASEYNSLVPGANIKVINVSDPQRADDLIKRGSIGFVSDEFYSGLNNEPLWKEVIGRDVIVTVINAKDPFLDEINLHGVSPELLSVFVKNPDYRNWGDLIGNGKTQKAEYYCLDDKATLTSLSDYLKTDEVLIAGSNKGDAAEVVAAIQKDPYALDLQTDKCT